MRIAIVNDLEVAVEVLKRGISSVPEHQIAWIARDGEEAVKMCAKDSPDLILMDLIMPVMNGVEATRCIMEQTPCPILVVTASVGENASKVFEAMGYGALDAVNTPRLGFGEHPSTFESLLNKIDVISKLIGKKGRFISPDKKKLDHLERTIGFPPLLMIGASTGGPKALSKLLSGLPRDLEAAVVIIQHVDAQFAGNLASWLSDQTYRQILLAHGGSRPHVGDIFLSASDHHLHLRSNLTLGYIEPLEDISYRPSVDVFFNSVAEHCPTKALKRSAAVLLTGMGKDGAQGMKALRDSGCYTIAEHQDSCVIFGMPKAAIECNAVVDILRIDDISPALQKFYERNRSPYGSGKAKQ